MDNTFLRIFETMDHTFTHKGRCSVCKDVQNFDVADGAAYLADTKVKIKCKKNGCGGILRHTDPAGGRKAAGVK